MGVWQDLPCGAREFQHAGTLLAAQKKLPAVAIPELFNGCSRGPEHFDLVVNFGVTTLKRA